MGTYWSGRSVTLWFLLVATVVRIDSLPITSLLDDDSDYDDSFENDYDLVFDQRQNGTANVRVSVDGVMVALPAPDMSPSATLAGATLLDLFASQLSAAGGEDDSSEETYGTISGSASSSAASATGASSTTSTTVAPTTSTTTATVVASDPLLASDFPYQGLSANLPASLLGQGLSFFFNPKRGEIPFRLNTAPESTNPAIPILITKLDKVPAARDPEANGSNEDSREIAASQETPKQQHAGKKKRKHKRKYKVRLANLLRPLLKRTVLVQ